MRKKRLTVLGLVLAGVLGSLVTYPLTHHAASAATSTAAFSDSFDGAHDTDPQYGLNDNVDGRQTGAVRGVTYTRVPGLWYAGDDPKVPLRPWHAQVGSPAYGGKLSFHLRTSAVRLDAPVVNDGTAKVSATLTPAVGTTASGSGWSSIVLAASAGSRGYVSDKDVTGALVTADGKLQVFHHGALLINTKVSAPAARYAVTLTVADSKNLTWTVNGQDFRTTLPQPLPARDWLFLGRYGTNAKLVSTVDDLHVSAVDPAALTVPTASGLRYFGYFAARIESIPTNHVPDVAGYSNLNWVSVSDSSGPKLDELAKCAPGTCMLNTRWQFFVDCPGPKCRLRADAEQQWTTFVAKLKSSHYVDRIAAFALMDEAYWQGASYEDTAAAAAMIKKTFPNIPVMLNFAAPSVKPGVKVPPAVDWVAFDQYCVGMDKVEGTLKTLETATASRPDVKLFVYTESARNLCGSTKKTDAAVAALQWDYYNLAVRHPRVAGILPFGLWTHDPSLSPLPKTVDAQQRIAARILTRR
ncbi:hypothetical protein [Kribbella sp. NPDC048928]|uniref:hypothetical protein n=1 Tax=Kribbella sp. NPDC048928 TaxID=3364111 RepID=UPI003713F931